MRGLRSNRRLQRHAQTTVELTDICLTNNAASDSSQKVFVPFTEALLGASIELGELVPYHKEYPCVRLLDGTYDFSPEVAPT